MITMNNFQDHAKQIKEATVIEACSKMSEPHMLAVLTHDWELDISDMVWECCHCGALLHSGERRFENCRGRR